MCCQCDFNGLIHVTFTYNCCCWGFESCFNVSSSIRSSEVLESRWKTGVLTSVLKVFFSWFSWTRVAGQAKVCPYKLPFWLLCIHEIPWLCALLCLCEVFMLEMLEPHYRSEIDFIRVSDNPHLRQFTNPLMGILHPWKPAFHYTNMWFWCGGNCCDKEIVVFCTLGGLKATTGWLKLISRFIPIHKSPLVSRVALTIALEVVESMMKTWVLAFVQKVFFSNVLFHLSMDLRKGWPF